MSTVKRIPSIHIREDHLKKFLMEYYDYADNIEDEVNEMVDHIMSRGSKVALEGRTVKITNQNIAKKVFNKITNDKTDITLLSQIIYSVRKQLKHKGIKPINNNSTEWTQLKRLTKIVNEYCSDFELEKREGYIEYVKAGLSKIKSYRGYITKLYDMSESISNERDANQYQSEDDNKTLTRKIYEHYREKVIKVTGINPQYDSVPIKYNNFIEVRKAVEKLKVTYVDYIDAQFDQLEWTGSYPEPEQLVNDKAIDRLNKYLYLQKKKPDTKKEKESDGKLVNVLNKLKKNGKNRN